MRLVLLAALVSAGAAAFSPDGAGAFAPDGPGAGADTALHAADAAPPHMAVNAPHCPGGHCDAPDGTLADCRGAPGACGAFVPAAAANVLRPARLGSTGLAATHQHIPRGTRPEATTPPPRA